jgi:hypothetical protein
MAESGIDARIPLSGLLLAFFIGGMYAPRVGRAIDAFDGRRHPEFPELGNISEAGSQP